jgi:hypothetical protein
LHFKPDSDWHIAQPPEHSQYPGGLRIPLLPAYIHSNFNEAAGMAVTASSRCTSRQPAVPRWGFVFGASDSVAIILAGIWIAFLANRIRTGLSFAFPK